MRVWRLSVAFIGPKSRTERPRKTKIGTKVAHCTCDADTTLKVKRSTCRGRGGAYCGDAPRFCTVWRDPILLTYLLTCCSVCCTCGRWKSCTRRRCLCCAATTSVDISRNISPSSKSVRYLTWQCFYCHSKIRSVLFSVRRTDKYTWQALFSVRHPNPTPINT